ncbi:MAG: efflux RND transporter permease subunit, partial [Spartobacteria bacterium]|nr:efflux RND transporter permease subunit [Spartobacteria bacterium]
MNITAFSLRNPFTVVAGILIVVALGLAAFFRMPTDLFPNTVPPQILVLTVRPGASASDVSGKITQVLEKQLNTLAGRVNVTSTTRDEVSSIRVEFDYDTPIGEAVTDVQNAVNRVRAALPDDIMEPRVYKITDATRPLVTLSLHPRPDGSQSLMQIRLLADNQLSDALLSIPGVADVQVFGAHQPEIQILADRAALSGYGLSLGELVVSLARQNISTPAGAIVATEREYLVLTEGMFTDVDSILDLPIMYADGGHIRVRDVATVELSPPPPRSIYHGNGTPAIAINLMRADNGPTGSTIKNIKAALPRLRAAYPDILFDVTDDQQPLIDINVQGMKSSLLQAIVITVFVIFMFLANAHAAAVVSISIPLAFLAGLMVLSLTPYTLNMVTLSGLIISVGMVVDASVVVLENIYRHFREENRTPADAALKGTSEVALETTAGMLTTIVVLVPVMFTGGYTQQVMRPLNVVIVATLAASLVCALTVVPLLASRLLTSHARKPNVFERIAAKTDIGVNLLARFYTGLLGHALRHRAITLITVVILFAFTMRMIVPLLGGELMPPMDTGIVLVAFDTPTDAAPEAIEKTLERIETMIQQTEGVQTLSSVIGSEVGQVSFGGGGTTIQGGVITVHLVDRTQRSATIWDIEKAWRQSLEAIPGVRTFKVSEYGATPMSTTKAPLDIIVSGADPVLLSQWADRVLTALKGMPGITDVQRSWYVDKTEYIVEPDPELLTFYKTSAASVALELKNAIKGLPAGKMDLAAFLDIPVTVRYAGNQMHHPDQLAEVYVNTAFGAIPLSSMAEVKTRPAPPFVTREGLRNTIDITAVNQGYTIKQVAAMVKERVALDDLPAGYEIAVSGTASDMAIAQKSMGKALLLGLILLYILLVAMFKSFLHPITVFSAIPLAVAGAMWGL